MAPATWYCVDAIGACAENGEPLPCMAFQFQGTGHCKLLVASPAPGARSIFTVTSRPRSGRRWVHGPESVEAFEQVTRGIGVIQSSQLLSTTV